MQTLSDFKRAIKPGTKLHCIYHRDVIGRNSDMTPVYGNEDKGIREVSKVQTNAFTLKTMKPDGKVFDSWLSYPKATECEITYPDTIVIFETDRNGNRYPILTYHLIA